MEITSDKQFREIVVGLRGLGYDEALLQVDYKFSDWFSPFTQERQVAAAAFGQTPVSYDSACIGVVCANGARGQALVNRCRALGAPILLEITDEGIEEWAVSHTENGHGLVDRYSHDRIGEMFANRAAEWRPESLLRAKNVGSFHWNQQLGLFAGLLPELEEHIQEKLDPLLRATLFTTRSVYRDTAAREPDATQLFTLVFWILTAKVFSDRRVTGFVELDRDPDQLLGAVAKHYCMDVPRLLNREARQAATDRIWADLDFRNLSVEVLSQIWSTTLVDEDTRRRLGIHRTSRTIVRYIVERMPFNQLGDDKRIILEPFAGSAVFLIGAMNELRHRLFGATPAERHKYFVQHLMGIEKDPFAVEISRLALTLADFPNADGWKVVQDDVFDAGKLTNYLRRAGVVLCNPPFGDFDSKERRRYQPSSTHKPAELLRRVLDDLHPQGVIGFVLPRNIVDGRGYSEIRRRLARRFATIELTLLPDRAFDADSEVGLLIATDPIPHNTCRIVNRRVDDNTEAWERFERSHTVSSDYPAEFAVEDAGNSFAVPPLPEVWAFLINYPTLGEVAELHRGIEWNQRLVEDGIETGHRSKLVRNGPAQDFRRGVAPKTTFHVFETPEMSYLSLRPADQRTNAWRLNWDKPKAIVNKSARSRGKWRMAAFPDSEGVTFYQTYIGVWPSSARFDESLLSAVLNSPVANAFVATREGKTDITLETLRLIPMPHFTESERAKLRSLIKQYIALLAAPASISLSTAPEFVLKQIDAAVLDGYRMPPRLERQVLDFFRGHSRSTLHPFSDYIPKDCEVYFPLSDHLSPDFSAATSGELLKRMAER